MKIRYIIIITLICLVISPVEGIEFSDINIIESMKVDGEGVSNYFIDIKNGARLSWTYTPEIKNVNNSWTIGTIDPSGLLFIDSDPSIENSRVMYTVDTGVLSIFVIRFLSKFEISSNEYRLINQTMSKEIKEYDLQYHLQYGNYSSLNIKSSSGQILVNLPGLQDSPSLLLIRDYYGLREIDETVLLDSIGLLHFFYFQYLEENLHIYQSSLQIPTHPFETNLSELNTVSINITNCVVFFVIIIISKDMKEQCV